MAKKSALQKIESHEKIVGGMGAVLITLLTDIA